MVLPLITNITDKRSLILRKHHLSKPEDLNGREKKAKFPYEMSTLNVVCLR